MREAVFRFAPSPNGHLHLGHAASALINAHLAQKAGGRFLLRIEDIDLGRSREEFVAAIFDDLRWLGLHWEQPILRQSEHLDTYAKAASRLADLGLLYPCFATRSEINEAVGDADGVRDPDGAPIYPGLHRGMPESEVCRRKAAGEPFAMRVDMAKAVEIARKRLGGVQISFQEIDRGGAAGRIVCDPMAWGDVVVQRKDVATSYHLSVVVDDDRQGISHVVRGTDLRAATPIHRLLQILLDLREPVYRHHGLVCDSGGRKLSKSEGATSLQGLRAAGATRDDIVQLLGRHVDLEMG
ncbi:MAG: tRNA glutamyl-Q(34) synthetase GluQRS [Alphaproteobacteria bacterium]|nr:tRNA glutamyl-Q(34) synthetase GluQRS [Alphaproteobacteria bacterium]